MKGQKYVCRRCQNVFEVLLGEAESCPRCGSDRIAQKSENEPPNALLPTNLSVFTCRYCGTSFSYVTFDVQEKAQTQYYFRRKNPKFCPSCGKPL